MGKMLIQMLISASWDLQFGNGDWYKKLVNKHVNISLLVVKSDLLGAGFWGNQERWGAGQRGWGAAPGPSKFLGMWLCPIPPGHRSLGSMVVSNPQELRSQLWLGFVLPREGWAFTGTYDDVNSRHAGSQGTNGSVVWWLSSERRVLGVSRGKWKSPKLGRGRAGVDLLWVPTESTGIWRWWESTRWGDARGWHGVA